MSRARMKKMANLAYGNILDIGFADAPNPFLVGNITGLDAQQVRKPEHYAEITVGLVDNICFAPNSFDTILAGEVIEHLDKPLQFLQGCFQLLRPGGQLILSTPNPYYPPYIFLNWFLLRKYFYNEGHLFAFTPRLMMRLCEMVGFEVEALISGGIVLPFRRIPIPTPRAICYQMIYLCRKRGV